jgi:hypothetical protein
MDQEQLAAGGAAIRGQSNEAAVEAALVACRRVEASGDVEAMDSREFNDFVREAAAGTTAVAGARSEDQQPRQSSAANSGPRSGRVRTGATTASMAATPARVGVVRQHEQAGQAPSRSLFEGCSGDDEDVKARDLREFDYYIKMQLQTQQLLTRLQQQQTQQLLTRLQQHPSPSSTEGGGGGEVAPAPASHLDFELRL